MMKHHKGGTRLRVEYDSVERYSLARQLSRVLAATTKCRHCEDILFWPETIKGVYPFVAVDVETMPGSTLNKSNVTAAVGARA